MNMKKSFLPLALSFVLCACGTKKSENESNIVAVEDNTLTTAETSENWQLLFDGKSATGWRGFNQKALPSGWIVEDGTLKSLGQGGDIGGDIVYGAEAFDNFELSLNWKISEGGNSGLFYHVVEGEGFAAAYENSPEYQLIDDIGFPQKLEPWQAVGADYSMYLPSEDKRIKKAGEWNTTRVIFTAEKVEYWLNGAKTLEFVPWSADWEKRKAEGKWKDFPAYGVAKSGLIGLQDHGSFIWFKNIKIRTL